MCNCKSLHVATLRSWSCTVLLYSRALLGLKGYQPPSKTSLSPWYEVIQF